MGISLSKGGNVSLAKISLSKERSGISKIRVGLGWDEVKKKAPTEKKGFFGKLVSGLTEATNGQAVDCDASILMLDENGKFTADKYKIYFANRDSRCGSIHHHGDNLTGEGDGDDEVIDVDLGRIPDNIHRLLFVVNIFDAHGRNQHFGMIENAFIRVLNDSNQEELVRFNLTDKFDGKTSLIVGEIYRSNGEWQFKALGEGSNAGGINELARMYT